MAIQEINTLKDLEALAPAWRNLLRNAATHTVFQTQEWVSSWWAVYGMGHRPRVLILREGEEVRGIAPLILKDYGVFRRLTFIGGHRADYSDFIVHRDRPQDYRLLLGHMALEMGDYDEVMLENVPESSPLLHVLEEDPRRFIIKRAVADACPYLTLDDRTESVLGKIEGKQSLKRKMKKLAAKGDLRFHHYTDPLEMEKAMVSLMETYLERFDPANLKKRLPMEIAFHRELLRRMGPEQMIQFSALELGERPIARHFGFSYDGVYHWVRPAFDPLYAEHSPGAVLLYHLIEHAWKNGFREFDFLRGKEAFKIDIAGQMRQVMMVKLYRSLPKYILCKAATAVNTWFQRLAFRQT